MTRSILLLGAESSAAEDVVAAARELGVDVHIATHPEVYERYDQELRSRLAGAAFADLRAPEEAVDKLTAYCAEHGITGVVVGWEFLTPLAAQLADRLGLPGNDPERSGATRNKWLMAQAFAAHRVPSPQCVEATTAEAARARAQAAGMAFPLVVKPAENAGSVGVAVVRSEQEFTEAFGRAQAWPVEFPYGIALDTTVLVQEYLEGPEFSVETVVFQGRYDHLAVTQKHTTPGGLREETGHTVPAALDLAVRAQVLDVVEQGLRALGVRSGVAHTELKVTPTGPRIIEIGARPPGGHIMKVVEQATGVSEARSYVQAALGVSPDTRPTRWAAAAIRFLSTERRGVFAGLRVTGDPAGVVALRSYLAPGTVIDSSHEKYARIGHVIVGAADPETANRLADAAIASIHIDVEE